MENNSTNGGNSGKVIAAVIGLIISIIFFRGLFYLSPESGFLKFILWIFKIGFGISVLKSILSLIGAIANAVFNKKGG